jgi:hypothetical protein
MIDVCAIGARYDALAPHRDERARRLFAASEATGIARITIGRGPSDFISLKRDSFHGEWNYTISPITSEPRTLDDRRS